MGDSEQSNYQTQSTMRSWSIPAPLSVNVAKSAMQWDGGLYYRSLFIVWTTTRMMIWFIS